MNVIPTPLADCIVIEPRVFADARGWLFESWRADRFTALGLSWAFVQENQSHSRRDVLRGLHFQHLHPQGKLVRVVQGEIFDVAVDLRRDSPTCGQWFGLVLSASNHRSLWVPPGFAHGFQVLGESADVVYKCTALYHPEDERTLLWSDPTVGVDWPNPGRAVVSDKDRMGTPWEELPLYAPGASGLTPPRFRLDSPHLSADD